MRAIRVRISTLVGLVVACALGLAALRRPTPETEQVVFTATAVALTLAILRAAHRPGAARAYWSAFALAGGTYLALSLIPATSGRLATVRALGYIFPWISSTTTTNPDQDDLVFSWSSGGYSIQGNSPFVPQDSAAFNLTGDVLVFTNKSIVWQRWENWRSFERSGHDLFAWLWGAIAGMIARSWWAGPKRRQAWDRLGRLGTWAG